MQIGREPTDIPAVAGGHEPEHADGRMLGSMQSTRESVRSDAGGHESIAATLVSAGCEVDAQDEDGNTPLISAVLHGHAAPVELLLAVGADMDVTRVDGLTVIDIAQLPGTPTGIRELILLGQDALE